MSEKIDPKDRIVSVTGQLTESGIKLEANSRAVSAIDRVTGGVINVAGNYIDRVANEQEQKNQFDSALRSAIMDTALQKITENKPLMDRMADSVIAENVGKYLNRAGIIAKYENELLLLTQSERDKATKNSDIHIDPDWLNVFYEYAGMASTEDMQNIFAKLLSGETVTPGSFPKKSLRIIHEMDRSTAETFKKMCEKYRFGNGFVFLRSEVTDVDDLIALSSDGLITGITIEVGMNLKINSDGYVFIASDNFVTKILTHENDRNKVLQLPHIPLTSLGSSLVKLLPPLSEELEKDSHARAVLSTNFSRMSAELYKLVRSEEGVTIERDPIEILVGPGASDRTRRVTMIDRPGSDA